MSTPLHVLILEDRETDAELMVYALRRAALSRTGGAWRLQGTIVPACERNST